MLMQRGVTVDTAGRVYTGNFGTGNFGDGVFSRVTVAADGTAKEQAVVSTGISCVDGIFYDAARDAVFIADSEKNALQVFHPATGRMTTLWENDDSDGVDGLLDQPCEVLVRGDELIVANFDMPFPGMKNKAFDNAHTLSIFRLAPAARPVAAAAGMTRGTPHSGPLVNRSITPHPHCPQLRRPICKILVQIGRAHV